MIGRVAGAQLELERTISALRAAANSVPADMDGQLADLVALRQEIATAGPSELPALNRAVTSLVATVRASTQQAQSAATDRAAMNIADATQASRQAVQSAMDYTRNLSLRFASDEDERDYRERESERAAYIAGQQAKHTPEGDLNASSAAIGQMVDAHAHGASGAEFGRHWNELVESTAKLRDAVRRSGGSTTEFDDRLRADLRRIMKAKGLSDTEIDAQFATRPDPLEAAKAYVSESDVAGISAKDATAMTTTDIGAAVGDDGKSSAIAKLRSAAIAVSEHPPDASFEHGVTVRDRPSGGTRRSQLAERVQHRSGEEAMRLAASCVAYHWPRSSCLK